MIPTILQTLLLTLSVVNLSSAVPYSDLDALARSGSLNCYVCNSKVGGCEPTTDFQKPCSDYFDVAYGKPSAPSIDLMEFPQALSERAPGSTAADSVKMGWHHGGFPGLYEIPAPPPTPATQKYRTSSLNQLYDAGKLNDGFATCRVLKISVNDQTNGGIRQEIPYTHPRIIRSCSFVKKKDLVGYNADGCKVIKHRNAYVEVCYCDSDNCNGSSYMRVSYWMIAASFLVIMAQFVMQK